MKISLVFLLVVLLQYALAKPGEHIAKEYRLISNFGNNPVNPFFGNTGQDLIHEGLEGTPLRRNYIDGFSAMNTLPNPRAISQAVFSLKPSNTFNKNPYNDYLTFWGQWIDHDTTLSFNNVSDAFPIPVPAGDAIFDIFNQGNQSLPFFRSGRNPVTGVTDARRILLNVTSFLDASLVYGSDEKSDGLRLHTDGFMRTSAVNGNTYCVRNDPAIVGVSPITHKAFLNGNGAFPKNVGNAELFLTGDLRGNDNACIMALHHIMIREHNRLAKEIQVLNPTLDDDALWNEARRWIIAFAQGITYNEYLPITIGEELPVYAGFNVSINPGIHSVYSTAAFRYGHSELNSVVMRVDEAHFPIPAGHFLVREAFFNPKLYEVDGVEPILRGMSIQRQQEVDHFYIDDMRSQLFGNANTTSGSDLVSINIWRGRDHGLPPLNECRVAYGLPKLTSFSDLSDRQEVVDALTFIYGGLIDTVDPLVAIGEPKDGNANVGRFFKTVIKDQYTRLRDGDRFFYKNPDAGFTADEITLIDSTKLTHIILRNTVGIAKLQCSIFFLPANAKALDCIDPEEPQDTGSTGSTGTTGDVKKQTFGDIDIKFSLGTDTVFMEVTAPTKGWVAVGFASTAGQMLKSDLIIGRFDGTTNTASVIDSFADDKSECDITAKTGVCADVDLGGTADLTSFAAFETVTNGQTFTTFNFTRKLVTGDSKDVAIAAGDVNLILAHSADDQDTVRYHAQFKTSGKINLKTGDSSTVTDPYLNIKQLHGALMFIAWGFLISIGGLVARFFKSKGAWWFKVHIFCQMTGVILMVAAFVMAIMFTDILNNPHFNAAHQKAGLVVVIFGLINPVLGSLADFLYKPDRKSTPIFPDFIHWIIGHLLIIGSFVVLFLGLAQLTIYTNVSVGLYVGLGAWVALYLILFSVFQLKGLNKAPHGGEKLDN